MPVKKLDLIIREREAAKQRIRQMQQAANQMSSLLDKGLIDQQRQVEALGGPSPEEVAMPQQ